MLEFFQMFWMLFLSCSLLAHGWYNLLAIHFLTRFQTLWFRNRFNMGKTNWHTHTCKRGAEVVIPLFLPLFLCTIFFTRMQRRKPYQPSHLLIWNNCYPSATTIVPAAVAAAFFCVSVPLYIGSGVCCALRHWICLCRYIHNISYACRYFWHCRISLAP